MFSRQRFTKASLSLYPDLSQASKGPDHWGDDVTSGLTKPSGPVDPNAPSMGYISPYTLPFPGKIKQEEVRAEPIGRHQLICFNSLLQVSQT